MALMEITALMALVPLMTWRETLMALMALMALVPLMTMTRGGDPPSPFPFFDIRRNLIVTHKRTHAQTHTRTNAHTHRQTASKLFISFDVVVWLCTRPDGAARS